MRDEMASFIGKIGSFVPKGFINAAEKMLNYAGKRESAEEWVGKTLLLAIAGFIVSYVIARLYNLETPYALLCGFLVYLCLIFVRYAILHSEIEDRKKRVESILPDLLRLVASNIDAGASPVLALRMSARPEFSPLDEEIRYATTKSLGTSSLHEALLEISKRINSEVLERAVSLFATSLKSGGSISRLLVSLAEEIEESQRLKRELIAGTSMYMIFILFAIIAAMPFLLAVSIKFIGIVSSLQSGMSTEMAARIGLAPGKVLSTDFVYAMSLITLAITSLMASMLLGVVHDGKKMNGIKFFPLILAASLLLFHLIKEYLLSYFIV
ncbi:MAG: type II secretion system F family protein [Candidatus Micrarchaeia archaeon]